MSSLLLLDSLIAHICVFMKCIFPTRYSAKHDWLVKFISYNNIWCPSWACKHVFIMQPLSEFLCGLSIDTVLCWFKQKMVPRHSTHVDDGLVKRRDIMVTSSKGNIYRVTGPLCGEFTGHQWILLTKDSDTELWCFLWSAPEQTVK